jgi:hypothetical protein
MESNCPMAVRTRQLNGKPLGRPQSTPVFHELVSYS